MPYSGPQSSLSRFVFAMTLVFLGSLSLSSGCSLLVDFEECANDADCPVGTCSDGVCATDSGQSCSTHVDCQADAALCIHEECRVVDTDLCTPNPDLGSDRETLVHAGMLMPLTGRNGEKGAATVTGAEIAIGQINDAQGGIGSASLSLITCDTQSNPGRAVDAANHLVNDLGIRVVIGALLSDATIDVAQNVTVDAGALLISPASTSPIISNLDDNGLVWRTIANDEQQGKALANLMVDRDYERVAVLFSSNAYGNGLLEVFNATSNDLGQTERLGDRDRFRTLQYDVESGSLVTESLVSRATTLFVEDGFMPDAIFVMGSIESQQIIFSLDPFFDELEPADQPVWILTDGGRDPGLFDSRFDGVKDRIQGTSPRELATTVTTQFRVRFEASSDLQLSNAPFADNAYDAMWLGALALAVQDNPSSPDPALLADVMTRLSDGDRFAPGDTFSDAVDTLREGDSIDFEGASGDVDFDPETGDVLNAIELWAIAASGNDFESIEVLIDAEGNPNR